MVDQTFSIGDTVINVYNNSSSENHSLYGRRKGFITKCGYDTGNYYIYNEEHYPFLIHPHYFYNSNVYEKFGFDAKFFSTCRLVLIEKTEKFWI